jgi:glycosyltransferase involved in cell wall biosynthesis
MLRVGFDVAQLSDKAFTGIPLYVESVLRELLLAGQEEYVLVGSDPKTDMTALLQRRNLPYVPEERIVPEHDTRLAVAYPSLSKSKVTDWFVRKVDGRIMMPINQNLLARKLGVLDVMHHTALIRVPSGPIRHHIITIYDLTTQFFPEMHTAINIIEWDRVFAFGRDHADLVITDSESARQDVIEHLGIPEDRVKAILLGVRPLPTHIPEDLLSGVRQKFGLEEGRFVLAAGSLEPRKNLPRLIEAFAELVRDPLFAEVKLVLTGARLHGAKAVEEAIQTQGIGERVVLTGYVSDEELAALMRGCDCFIYPSLYEGFGLPVVEAMAMGAPVATSNSSSLPEVAGNAALLFDPKSTPALTDAMCQVLSDAVFATELRQRGLERSSLFTWKRCADEHRRVYHEVAGT